MKAKTWIAAVVLLGAAALSSCQSEKDFAVEVLGDDTVKITGYTGKKTALVIPGKLQGKPVTVIGENAFIGAPLTSVVIPDSVTTIEDRAFYGQHGNEDGTETLPGTLTTVTIGAGCQTIGEEAFSWHPNLSEIVIPDAVTVIKQSAFASCESLSKVHLGASLQGIGNYAFDSDSIEELVIPDGVIAVGGGAFTYNAIRSLVIPQSLADKGLYNKVFEKCPLERVTLPEKARTDTLRSAGLEAGLVNVYRQQGQKAGTYVKNGSAWDME